MRSWIHTICIATLMTSFAGITSTARTVAACDCAKANCHTCPSCKYVCKFEAEKVDEKIPCFDVEEKVICIPRVVFPWQKSKCDPCANNGAWIRKVCVLKRDSYTCPKCEYSWKAEKKEICGGCGSCDAMPNAKDTAGVIPSPMPIQESVAEEFGPEPVIVQGVRY